MSILKLVGGLIGTLIILGTMFNGAAEKKKDEGAPGAGGAGPSHPLSSAPPPAG